MDRQSFPQAVRTTVAAAVSLLAARACGFPETYWAVVTTVVVMQSTLGASWNTSWQRLIGTFVGGITAAALVAFFTPGLLPFIAGMLAMGLLCSLLRLEVSAYRFAGVTLVIIMLPSHIEPIWTVALHRFFEVVFGIMIGMAVMALWPERAEPAETLPPQERAEPTVGPQAPR
jgi:uncharacterized membrane protein YccC